MAENRQITPAVKAIFIIFMFDEDSIAKITQLKHKYQSQFHFTDDIEPHLTLASFEGLKEEQVIKWSKLFFAEFEPFDVTTEELTKLNDQVLVLTVEENLQLKALHSNYLSVYNQFTTIWTDKVLGNWRPHVTISSDFNNPHPVHIEHRIDLKIEAVAVSVQYEDNTFQIVYEKYLKK